MTVTRPFRRTCRQFANGSYSEGGRWEYVQHPKFAKAPDHYVRAFLLLQEDLQRLFQYIEPTDTNLKTYSYRIHELLLRTCVEVEANCKAILLENGYSKPDNWTMDDYKKIECSHFVSAYRVKYPIWVGAKSIRQPFSPWSTAKRLPWYSAYNATKHDRHVKFHKANFKHLTDAITGLVVLLSAQFLTHDFAPSNSSLSFEGPRDGMESAIGGYFRVKFPDWPREKRYDFKWQELKSESDPFDKFPYNDVTLPCAPAGDGNVATV